MGDNIRRERKRNAWTQAELAERANLSVMALSRIERGQAEPRASTLRKIAAALEVRPGDLFDE